MPLLVAANFMKSTGFIDGANIGKPEKFILKSDLLTLLILRISCSKQVKKEAE